MIERYFTVDLRTLALFRVAFGLFLFGNLSDRLLGEPGVAFFTDLGVAPVRAVVALHRLHQWSPMYAVTTVAQLYGLIVVFALVYAAYTVGWHTRVMQVLVAGILVSLDQRNIILENGGGVVVNIAAIGTAFLPLGERFSIDALRKPPPERKSVARLAYGLLVLDFAIIYLFNFTNKTGAAWHDGSALHLVLWHARAINDNGFWLSMHEPLWFSPVFTRGTLYAELTLAILIASPVLQRQLRWTAILLIVGLHGGIALLMRIGPFSYIMICMSLLLVGGEDWDELSERLRPRLGGLYGRARSRLESLLGGPPPSPLPPVSAGIEAVDRRALALGRDGLLLVVAAASVCSLLVENPTVPEPIHLAKYPGWASAIVEYLRIRQQWNMFAPNAPHKNGVLVVDGVLADGTHLDPLTGRPPDFEPMFHPPPDESEAWRNYHFRITLDRFKKLQASLGNYIMRVHTLPWARIHEPIKHYDVYWVSYVAPAHPGELPTAVHRKVLFSGGRGAAPPVPPPTPDTTPASVEPAPSDSESVTPEAPAP